MLGKIKGNKNEATDDNVARYWWDKHMFKISQAISTDKSGEMIRSFWTIAQCSLMLLPAVSPANFRNSSPDCSGKATKLMFIVDLATTRPHWSFHCFLSFPSMKQRQVKKQQNDCLMDSFSDERDFWNVLPLPQNIFFAKSTKFHMHCWKKFPWNFLYMDLGKKHGKRF